LIQRGRISENEKPPPAVPAMTGKIQPDGVLGKKRLTRQVCRLKNPGFLDLKVVSLEDFERLIRIPKLKYRLRQIRYWK